MRWLSPLWLVAAAAVVVPIVLHLRDRHPPDVIRVGSVVDLDASPAVRRRRLDDILLLLLRCLVITVTAVLFAGPRVAQSTDRPGERVALVGAAMEDTLDSLRATGLRIAVLPRSPHPWSLAAWGDTVVGAGDTLLIVGTADSTAYRGVRPIVTHPVATDRSDPPAGIAASHVTPRVVVTGPERAPLRDARPIAWWFLLAAVAVERAVAARRRT